MTRALVQYLAQRPDASTFLLPADVDRALGELFGQPERLLPQPYKIFPADETQPPVLGFAVAESQVLKDLDQKLERWLAEETQWREPRRAEGQGQAAFSAYIGQLMKAAENALTSNLLSDYHAVFWLAHRSISRGTSRRFRGASASTTRRPAARSATR
jgi:hypothetical protein